MSTSDKSPTVVNNQDRPSLAGPLLALTLLIVAAGCLVLWSVNSADSEEATQTAVESAEEIPDISAETAARIHDVRDSEEWQQPPFSTQVSGQIVEVTEHYLSLQREGETKQWPLAADMMVWDTGQLLSPSELENGDRVDVSLQQLGSRQDGWINTVVKVDVVSSSQVSANERTTKQFQGEVVELTENSITILGEDDTEMTLAVETPTVANTDTSANLSTIDVGDIVNWRPGKPATAPQAGPPWFRKSCPSKPTSSR